MTDTGKQFIHITAATALVSLLAACATLPPVYIDWTNTAPTYSGGEAYKTTPTMLDSCAKTMDITCPGKLAKDDKNLGIVIPLPTGATSCPTGFEAYAYNTATPPVPTACVAVNMPGFGWVVTSTDNNGVPTIAGTCDPTTWQGATTVLPGTGESSSSMCQVYNYSGDVVPAVPVSAAPAATAPSAIPAANNIMDGPHIIDTTTNGVTPLP
jgi:hypothetical protein